MAYIVIILNAEDLLQEQESYGDEILPLIYNPMKVDQGRASLMENLKAYYQWIAFDAADTGALWESWGKTEGYNQGSRPEIEIYHTV